MRVEIVQAYCDVCGDRTDRPHVCADKRFSINDESRRFNALGVSDLCDTCYAKALLITPDLMEAVAVRSARKLIMEQANDELEEEKDG